MATFPFLGAAPRMYKSQAAAVCGSSPLIVRGSFTKTFVKYDMQTPFAFPHPGRSV